MSALGWARRGSFRGVHTTDPNLAFPFDSVTLPRYQPHADCLIPPGKILGFTRGPKQKKIIGAAKSFPKPGGGDASQFLSSL